MNTSARKRNAWRMIANEGNTGRSVVHMWKWDSGRLMKRSSMAVPVKADRISRSEGGLLVSSITAVPQTWYFNAESWISENGDAWSHFSHDHARSRAFRWGWGWHCGCMVLTRPTKHCIQFLEPEGRQFKGAVVWALQSPKKPWWIDQGSPFSSRQRFDTFVYEISKQISNSEVFRTKFSSREMRSAAKRTKSISWLTLVSLKKPDIGIFSSRLPRKVTMKKSYFSESQHTTGGQRLHHYTLCHIFGSATHGLGSGESGQKAVDSSNCLVDCTIKTLETWRLILSTLPLTRFRKEWLRYSA